MFKTFKRIRQEAKKSYQTAETALQDAKKQKRATKLVTGPVAATSERLTELLEINHFAETLIATIRTK